MWKALTIDLNTLITWPQQRSICQNTSFVCFLLPFHERKLSNFNKCSTVGVFYYFIWDLARQENLDIQSFCLGWKRQSPVEQSVFLLIWNQTDWRVKAYKSWNWHSRYVCRSLLERMTLMIASFEVKRAYLQFFFRLVFISLID